MSRGSVWWKPSLGGWVCRSRKVGDDDLVAMGEVNTLLGTETLKVIVRKYAVVD